MSIRAEQLGRRYGEKVALEGLDLQVAPGEIYGLIGPNGAGKTTALRMLAGLMSPSTGRAEICGIDVARDPDCAKARLGFMTGTTGLYGRLTVKELLVYFGALYGMSRGDVGRRIDELAVALRFQELLARRCQNLSTGERQRVSLARATLHDPPVLILDEPTAGLDVLASRFVADVIRAARERRRAILFSTHYMTEAELLCDRIGLLHGGRLLHEGTPDAVKSALGVPTLEAAFLSLAGAAEAAP